MRQLRDMKASYKLADFTPADLVEFAQACGYALARAHAKGGDAEAICGYLGRSRQFAAALTDFGEAYADLNEADFKRLHKAVASGKLEAVRVADKPG